MSLQTLLMATLMSASLLISAGERQRIEVELGSERFTLEVVDDEASRNRGLMGREQLGANEGMLFDFPAGTRPSNLDA